MNDQTQDTKESILGTRWTRFSRKVSVAIVQLRDDGIVCSKGLKDYAIRLEKLSTDEDDYTI